MGISSYMLLISSVLFFAVTVFALYRHPSAADISNRVRVRFCPPKDIPVELYIKVFVGYRSRY